MLHHTASTAPDENMVRYLAYNEAPVSCHDMVGRDGTIWKIAESIRSTWHAGTGGYDGIVNTMNLHAIGIEVHSDGYDFTDAQREATKALIKYYMKKYNIPIENVIRHVDYSAPRKRDIGDNFWNNEHISREAYKEQIKNELETAGNGEQDVPEGYGIVGLGIWNGKRPNDYATRLEVATMIERTILLQEHEELFVKNPEQEDLDRATIPDGASEDGADIDYSHTILPRDVPRCKTNYFKLIKENPELGLNQDEFKDRSPRCTVYAHLADFVHKTGKLPSAKDRKRIIAWMIKYGPLGEDHGAPTMEIASLRGRCLNELGIYKGKIETYYFPTGHRHMNHIILFKNQSFVSATVMNEGLAKDRRDDKIINGEVHGGKIYGGHAHCYAALSMKHIGFVNSYKGRNYNHFAILRGFYKDWFNKKRSLTRRYVRDYSALHLYK